MTRFRYFRETSHTVDDSALVQVLRSYYAAIPASPGDIVTVRLYEHDVEILDAAGQMLRRHPRSTIPGHFELKDSDRIFNPSRETVRLLGRVAKLGPNSLALGRDIFLRLGRPGQKALYGMSNLPRRYAKQDIENAARRVLTLSQPSYHALSASSSVTPSRPSAALPCRSCDKPGRTSATSRNTTPSSKTHNSALTIRRAIPHKIQEMMQ